jgi:hypothetical protein
MRKENIRIRFLDIYILILSIIAIIGGLVFIAYCLYIEQIKILKPYLLFGTLVFLGILGIRYYRNEVEI